MNEFNFINLIEYFEKTVNLFPNKLAISNGRESLTFLRLQVLSKKIAVQIQTLTDIKNRPIAIFLPKNNDAIVAILGALYSGNCYAPLDILNSGERLKSILSNLNPLCIITNTELCEKIKDFDFDIINIDLIEGDSSKDIEFNFKS